MFAQPYGPPGLATSFFLFAFLFGCATGMGGGGMGGGDRSADVNMPAEMSCVSNTDPSCIGQAGVMFQIPFSGESKGSSGSGSAGTSSLFGFCELFVEGDVKPQSCAGIRLVVRSSRDNVEKTVDVKDFDFKIQDLEAGSYKIDAISPTYQLQTESESKGPVNPGQKLKIRVRAKPRP